MSNFVTANRFSVSGLVFAAVMTLSLQGSLLVGFERIAQRGDRNGSDATLLAKTPTERPVVMLERVVVTSRRA